MSEMAVDPADFPAVPTPRSVGARWWAALVRFLTLRNSTVVDAAVDTVVATDDQRKRRAHTGRNYEYIEQAAMSRAMDRL